MYGFVNHEVNLATHMGPTDYHDYHPKGIFKSMATLTVSSCATWIEYPHPPFVYEGVENYLFTKGASVQSNTRLIQFKMNY